MKVTNEVEWLEIKHGYERHGPDGAAIVAFAEMWATKVEESLEAGTLFRKSMDLRFASTDHNYPLNLNQLAEVLVILSQVWGFREELVESLSPIEVVLWRETLASKLEALQELAAANST